MLFRLCLHIKMTLNWGIIGCGKISHDFCLAVTRVKSSRHHFKACASSSSLQLAQDFSAKFGISKAYGSYDELVADPEIGIKCYFHLKVKFN